MPPDVAIDNAQNTPDAGYLCCGVKRRQRINDAARIKMDKVIRVTCQQPTHLGAESAAAEGQLRRGALQQDNAGFLDERKNAGSRRDG